MLGLHRAIVGTRPGLGRNPIKTQSDPVRTLLGPSQDLARTQVGPCRDMVGARRDSHGNRPSHRQDFTETRSESCLDPVETWLGHHQDFIETRLSYSRNFTGTQLDHHWDFIEIRLRPLSDLVRIHETLLGYHRDLVGTLS